MSYEDANNKLLLMFKLYKMIPDGKFKVATASHSETLNSKLF